LHGLTSCNVCKDTSVVLPADTKLLTSLVPERWTHGSHMPSKRERYHDMSTLPHDLPSVSQQMRHTVARAPTGRLVQGVTPCELEH